MAPPVSASGSVPSTRTATASASVGATSTLGSASAATPALASSPSALVNAGTAVGNNELPELTRNQLIHQAQSERDRRDRIRRDYDNLATRFALVKVNESRLQSELAAALERQSNPNNARTISRLQAELAVKQTEMNQLQAQIVSRSTNGVTVATGANATQIRANLVAARSQINALQTSRTANQAQLTALQRQLEEAQRNLARMTTTRVNRGTVRNTGSSANKKSTRKATLNRLREMFRAVVRDFKVLVTILQARSIAA